jgi:hypothetical protein
MRPTVTTLRAEADRHLDVAEAASKDRNAALCGAAIRCAMYFAHEANLLEREQAAFDEAFVSALTPPATEYLGAAE